MVKCTLFYGSGYNATNIPQLELPVVYPTYGLPEPSVIPRREFPAIDIVQLLFLTSIRIKAREIDLQGADFLVLEDTEGDLFQGPAFYFVNPVYSMTSRDVAQLSLVMSGYLTLTAQSTADEPSYQILDGFVERDSKIPTDTVMEDPLLFYRDAPDREVYGAFGAYPDRPVGLLSGKNGYFSPFDAGFPLSESTDFLAWDGSLQFNNIYASTYSDKLTDTEVDAATAPVEITVQDGHYIYSPNFNTAPLMLGKLSDQRTEISMDGGGYADQSEAYYEYPGVTFYSDDSNMLNAARLLYGMGVPNPISISYQLPVGFADIEQSNGVISKIKGKAISYRLEKSSDDLFGPILYGGLRKEVKDDIANTLVQIKLTAIGTGQQSTITRRYMHDPDVIVIDMVADPSPNGAPFYKIRDKQTVRSIGMQIGPTSKEEGPSFQYGTMNGAVRGSSWLPSPIVYANLGYIERESEYNARYAMAQVSSVNAVNQQEQQNYSNAWRGYINSGLSVASAGYSDRTITTTAPNNPEGAQMLNGGPIRNAGPEGYLNFLSPLSGWINQSWQLVDADRNLKYQVADALNSAVAMRDMFQRQNATNVYNTQFAYTGGISRMLGNGVLIEIIMPNDSDVENAVHIIQRYGFPCNHPAKTEYFKVIDDGETEYDYRYIRTRGLSLSPSGSDGSRRIPAMLYRMAEMEINGGVRIWKVKPDEKLYDKTYLLKG